MQELTIKINSTNWDFLNSIDEIKKQIQNWFLEWFNENSEENYNFKVN